ncbi:MAG: phosphatase PAP2 family protein [Clostridia bacterium]|nr:phosphatase PAP2 family protein [Clostridia bacterium]
MIEWLANLDLSVAEYFVNGTFPALLDKVMVFITSFGDAGALWIACGVIFLIFKKTRTCGVAMLLSLAITFLISQLVIKEIVGRPRPFVVVPGAELLVSIPHGSSFPSSHAATSFAAAASIFCFNKIHGAVALALALIIGFTRIYLYVHFLSDVVVGAVLGITIGICLTRVLFFKKDSEVDTE